MNNKERQDSRKLLAYLVCSDMIKSAIDNSGSINTADPIGVSNIIAEKLHKAATKKEHK